MDGKALEWFASYLADRTQRVTVNNGLSSAFPLRQGVPPGSCLGPLLFTVYTSKLFEIAMQMTHSCIWHSVLMCKERTRPR